MNYGDFATLKPSNGSYGSAATLDKKTGTSDSQLTSAATKVPPWLKENGNKFRDELADQILTQIKGKVENGMADHKSAFQLSMELGGGVSKEDMAEITVGMVVKLSGEIQITPESKLNPSTAPATVPPPANNRKYEVSIEGTFEIAFTGHVSVLFDILKIEGERGWAWSRGVKFYNLEHFTHYLCNALIYAARFALIQIEIAQKSRELTNEILKRCEPCRWVSRLLVYLSVDKESLNLAVIDFANELNKKFSNAPNKELEGQSSRVIAVSPSDIKVDEGKINDYSIIYHLEYDESNKRLVVCLLDIEVYPESFLDLLGAADYFDDAIKLRWFATSVDKWKVSGGMTLGPFAAQAEGSKKWGARQYHLLDLAKLEETRDFSKSSELAELENIYSNEAKIEVNVGIIQVSVSQIDKLGDDELGKGQKMSSSVELFIGFETSSEDKKSFSKLCAEMESYFKDKQINGEKLMAAPIENAEDIGKKLFNGKLELNASGKTGLRFDFKKDQPTEVYQVSEKVAKFKAEGNYGPWKGYWRGDYKQTAETKIYTFK